MKWPMVKLGDVFKVTSGGTPSRAKREYYDNGHIPWIKTGDLHNKYVTEASEFITESGLKNSSARLYPKGTILLAMYGATIGACSILAIDACTNQACAAFTPNNDVDTLFLYYLLKHNQPSFIMAGAGGAQPNISATFLKNFEIPLPPLEEQKRIAVILDKADAIRQKRQQAIALADDFLRSVFLDMFGDPATNPKGWEITNIGSLCNVSSGSTPSRQRDDYYKGNIPWVKTTEIDGYTIIDTEEHISEEALQESSCRLNEVGSILIAMYGQGKTRGKVGLLGIKAATNQACAVLSPSQKINMHYLYGFLSLSYENLRRLGQGGGQPNLNGGIIKSFPVPLPPKNLQNKFATVYEKIKSLQKEKETAQQQKNLLLSSLSKKAFSGQL